MANVYRRGSTYWVRFRAGGQHVRRSARTTKKAEAQAYLQRLIEEHAARGRGDRQRHRWPEAVGRFFDETSIKPKTRRCYATSGRTCAGVLGALHLDEIDRRRLADLVSARKRAGVADATIRRDLAFVSSVCSMAVRWGWLDTNPVTAFGRRTLRESRPRTRFLSRREFDRLLAAAGPPLRPALVLAVETGLRKEELFGLTAADLDLGRREIHLERTKTNAPRRVPLSDKALATLRDLLGPDHLGPSHLLRKPDGSRYADMKKGFAAACRRAGITNFRWHDLRHTFASWFVQGGGDLYRLSRILGHSSLQMSARYGHLRVDDLHAELRRVGDAAQNRSQERLIGGPDADAGSLTTVPDHGQALEKQRP